MARSRMVKPSNASVWDALLDGGHDVTDNGAKRVHFASRALIRHHILQMGFQNFAVHRNLETDIRDD
jgi:hypothetical protein